jgi:hypothetical protein
MAGAPVGNQNAARAKRWREAIIRALARPHSGDLDKGLDAAADKLAALAFEGDKWAIDHIADRLDGKVPQGIIGGDEGEPAIQIIQRQIVRANPKPSDG